MATLEDAIKKIGYGNQDLASTFETVNSHFSRMFPSVRRRQCQADDDWRRSFGCGVQVMAQPPGAEKPDDSPAVWKR
jgi:chromosome segregation ATPase